MKKGKLLHVGCGTNPLPEWLSGFEEVRLDINPDTSPDIVASMLDLGDIGEYDAILCVHALEHMFKHEVPIVLSEFKRVLKTGGYVMVFVPDLEGVTPDGKILFESPSGGITGHDLFYGFGKVIKENPYMIHKTGFIKITLENSLNEVGFSKIEVKRLRNYDMMGVGVK